MSTGPAEGAETVPGGEGGGMTAAEKGVSDARPVGRAPEETLMEQNETNDDERIEGIIVQTRADVDGGSATEIEHVLRTRLRDAAIEVDEGEITVLVEHIISGAEGPWYDSPVTGGA